MKRPDPGRRYLCGMKEVLSRHRTSSSATKSLRSRSKDRKRHTRETSAGSGRCEGGRAREARGHRVPGRDPQAPRQRDRGRSIEPMSYIDLGGVIAESRLVLTNSGGIQKETSVLGIPCLTLRENTEHPITVTQGTNRIVGVDKASILKSAYRSHERRGISTQDTFIGRLDCGTYREHPCRIRY